MEKFIYYQFKKIRETFRNNVKNELKLKKTCKTLKIIKNKAKYEIFLKNNEKYWKIKENKKIRK